jgi:hypothetical protein
MYENAVNDGHLNYEPFASWSLDINRYEGLNMFVFNWKSTYQIEQWHKENMKYSMHVNIFKA